ncbi:MAG: MEKHLA domain-containing protein [Dehalococcoidia bacterium]|nr:MEKHLA domain-containing protein [Dehalococcoidia bacterium]
MKDESKKPVRVFEEERPPRRCEGRKRAEQRVWESGERFRALIENASDAVAILNAEGIIVYESPSAERVLGYGPQDLVGKPMLDFVHPDDVSNVAGIFASILNNPRTPMSTELRFRHKDDSWHWLEGVGNNLLDDPQVQGVVANYRDITERKRAEQASRESEDRYRDLLENANDLIQSVSPDGHFLYVNRAWQEALGYNEEEIAGLSLVDIIHPDSQAHTTEAFQQLLSGGKAARVEAVLLAKDGREIVVEGTANCKIVDGKPVHIRGILRDVTERKQAEEALRESEAKYAALVEQAVDGVIIVQDGVFKFANEGMAEIAGYTVEEMESMPFLDIVVSELRESVAQRFASRMAGEQLSTVYETKIRCKDGTVKEVEAHSRTIQYQGSPSNLSIVRDVTERKRAERAVRESEERFRGLTESTSDWVWEVDVDGVYTYASPKVKDLLGYQPEEVIGKSPFDLMPPEEAKRIAEEFQAIMESHTPFARLENTNLDKDGRLVVLETSGVPFFDADGRLCGYRGIDRDITERKRAEEALQKQMHDLGERVKELNCLYAISSSRLASKQDASLEEILEGVVGLIPPAWQYPEITCARITLGDQEFRTENFSEAIWKQSSNIVVEGNPIGTVEVYYLQEKPGADEGPFLKEERSLIEAIGERLGRITERKRAEEALRESEEKYRRLVGTLHEGVWVIDKDAYTTFVNPPMAEMLGYTPDEMGGKHLFSFMDERGVEIAKRDLERRQRGIPEQHDFEFIRKDGTRIYTILATGPIADDHGNYAGAVAGVLDITERKRLEGETLQRNRELAALHHILLSITQTLDLQEVLEEIVSQAGTALGSGYTSIVTVNEDGSLGIDSETFSDIPSLSIRARPEGVTRRIVASGQPIIIDDVDAEEGTTPAIVAAGIKSYAGVPIKTKDATIGVLFVHSSQPNAFANRLNLLEDLANQAAIAIENARLYKEASTVGALREADRLKTELLSNVSHELRTPLTSIKGYCTSMLHFYDRLSDEDRLDSLREINQASDKLTKLVENLLELSRLQAAGLDVEKEPTRVESVISAAVEHIREKAKGYHFVTRVAESLPMVKADPGRIRQVLDNLLSNAVKFSPEGTEISVSCEAKGQELMVSVRDCGKGMSREDLDKVFDRFYQVSPGLVQQGSGAGLGLAICKHIVEAHGGRIWAESKPRKGSTFVFTLPLTAEGKF